MFLPVLDSVCHNLLSMSITNIWNDNFRKYNKDGLCPNPPFQPPTSELLHVSPFNNLKSIEKEFADVLLSKWNSVPLWQALGLVEEWIWVCAPKLVSLRVLSPHRLTSSGAQTQIFHQTQCLSSGTPARHRLIPSQYMLLVMKGGLVWKIYFQVFLFKNEIAILTVTYFSITNFAALT